ncbi:MAG: dipeptidase [Oscillospiraceae bacterium]|nr:dipeptidase [Oscillospiraceae bacterium]
MKFIDMHCDTLMPFVRGTDYNIYSNDKQVDFLKMKKGDAMAQFFAVFFPKMEMLAKQGIEMNDDLYFKLLTEGFYRDVEKHNDIIAFAGNAADIEKNEKDGKMSAILTIEDGRFINGDMDKIKMVYDRGVRAISLTWNFENCFGWPNSKDKEIMGKGLKDFGIEAIQYMNDLGIIVDVSHLSDGGFYDVAKYSKKPFVATHSNARAVSPHQRNLTDDMIRLLGEKGGVTGLNFCPEFMDADITAKHTPISNIVKNAKHIVNVGGIDCLGLGTDFDGIGGTQEIADSSMIPLLWDALKKEGFHESEIEKISHGNVLRVIRESMK